MEDSFPVIISNVIQYYNIKIHTYGATPAGVDWNSAESQQLRFNQLIKLLPEDIISVDVVDIGCGYGAFYSYLLELYKFVDFEGIDVSDQMIKLALKNNGNKKNVSFTVSNTPAAPRDYCFSSGIFNVRLDTTIDNWRNYIESTLDIMDMYSRKGFAFNCLSSYSDSDKRKDYLYYADPLYLFDLCKNKYSKNVALLHDYSLFEFTILVRK